MPNLLPFLAGLLCGAILGCFAGRVRRDRTVKGDTLEWWRAGWDAATEACRTCGHNPLKKRTTFATLDELAPKILHDGDTDA